jgi:hypothetical protein
MEKEKEVYQQLLQAGLHHDIHLPHHGHQILLDRLHLALRIHLHLHLLEILRLFLLSKAASSWLLRLRTWREFASDTASATHKQYTRETEESSRF